MAKLSVHAGKERAGSTARLVGAPQRPPQPQLIPSADAPSPTPPENVDRTLMELSVGTMNRAVAMRSRLISLSRDVYPQPPIEDCENAAYPQTIEARMELTFTALMQAHEVLSQIAGTLGYDD